MGVIVEDFECVREDMMIVDTRNDVEQKKFAEIIDKKDREKVLTKDIINSEGYNLSSKETHSLS